MGSHRQTKVAQNKKTATRSMQNQVFTFLRYLCIMTTMYTFQLYARRKKYVKDGERKYWDSIDPSFMSEESTHESDGEHVVHKHTPTFRSEGLIMLQLVF